MALLLALAAGAARAESRVLYDKRSPFNHVIVRQEDGGIRSLTFEDGGATQTAMDVNDPERLVISYTRAAMAGLAIVPRPQRILMVGLGGGAMPMFLRRNYPDATIDVVELDREVVNVATQFFGFREDEKMKVHVGDGRKFIETTENRYDVIFLDAYGSDSIPYALATREFLRAVKQKVTEDGVVIANVWGSAANKLYGSMVKTYVDVFGELHIVQAMGSANRILMALPKKAGLTKDELARRAGQVKLKHTPALDLVWVVKGGYESVSEAGREGKVLLDAEAP
jgi:spermidine synthase